ncbi:GNAT family N-acetyltransferase [Paenibacillus sp. SYP-B3998]|uniref:GNAT family N-acetyltransferase n=1 Tax=Paenibacillus sp. SYP-B3998 TaxID=2678564 RepID=A0A6G3ZY97_9BACL|nr:GNAT family N-acetyltransferase [Paenibacillus sp. SYP-B3998]NEW06664.1 GNAT family N-acetyltransferase [Paenibacillus sp. SYP-B3998]
MIQVRIVEFTDLEAFWQLRLEALRTTPEAFSASYEENIPLTMSEVEKRFHYTECDTYIIGAFTEENQLVGLMGFRREQRIKLKHKGTIWGVYVTPTFRGKGIAKQLLAEILRRGKQLDGLKKINLSVVSTNQNAVELYRKLGFETYGTEKNALVVNGHGYDEEFMTYTY